ncbi:hypothetical protein IIA95_00345 [Patescibacteria group bacterium]|nr:hypothetical protein [Patescibacteria group bacterium]
MAGKELDEEYKGYCVKCRKKDVTMQNPKEIIMKGKAQMRAAQGTCPRCGTKITRILGKAK